jgi:hypothetical protein
MRAVLLGLAVAVALASTVRAEPKAAFFQYFPPQDCSASEFRVMEWRDDARQSPMRCVSRQEVLKAALPECKAGQFVMFDGKAFLCSEAPASAKAAR